MKIRALRLTLSDNTEFILFILNRRQYENVYCCKGLEYRTK